MRTSKPERIGDITAFPEAADGSLYVLKSSISDRYGEWDLLHVISKHAGGEIRGYRRAKGQTVWELRHPAYPGEWEEMDRAVADLVREPVVGFLGKHHSPAAKEVA